MAKLRNASTDVGKMSQYLARKCVIHSPQAELDIGVTEGFKTQRFGENEHYKGSQVHMIKRRGQPEDVEPNEFVAISPSGRAMKVTVEEIDPTTFDKAEFAKVGG